MAANTPYQTERTCEEDYDILKLLGEGTYGKVVMAVDKRNGRIVALKLVNKELTNIEAFMHELSVSIFLTGHNGIIATHSSYLDTSHHFILSQELAPAGCLQSIIRPGIGIPEKMVKRCALQITEALQYMHSKNLVHRDLKPDNVLIMDKRCHSVKLSDFGLTQVIGTRVPSMSPINPYMYPELGELKHVIQVDPSVDLWAFGVLLYFALTGCHPWSRALVEDPLYKRFVYWQKNIHHVPPPTDWKMISRRAQDLFHFLPSLEPSCRNDVGIVLHYLHFTWHFGDATQEIIDLVEQEEKDAEMDCETEVIVIEDDEFIIVENHGDLECIIVCDQSSEVAFTNSAVIILNDHSSLSLGSEVEV